MPGIYPSAAFFAPEVSSSASPTTPGACISSHCLGILNRRANQQRLVDGIAQLNGGGGGAAQVSHRDRNNISAGPPRWHDDAGGEHDVDQAVVVAERRAEFEKDNGSGR